MRKILLTLLTTLLCSVTAWGATYTWNFVGYYGTTKTTLTSGSTYSFTSETGSKTLSYKANSSDVFYNSDKEDFFKLGGATQYSSSVLSSRYFTLTAPSSNGTITINYAAGTKTGTAMIRSANGDYTTLSQAASTSVTSSVLSGLTANTTTIYIGFSAQPYINSITWTDADAPASMTTLYESDIKTSLATGASAVYTNAAQQSGGSGWVSSYTNYMKASNSNASAAITFTSPLALNSNGSNKGKIRIHYASTGKSLNATAIGSLSINGGSSLGTATVLEKNQVHIVDFTIPDATVSLSSVAIGFSPGSSGDCLLHIEVLTHSSGSCTATANAGADKNTTVNTGVALAATAAGDGKTGAWTVQSAPDGATGDYAPTFSSTSSATATFTPKVKGSYTLRWTVTCTEGESSANDDMEVSVCAPITPTFSTDYTSTTLTVGGGNSSTPVVNKDGSSGDITWTSSAPAKATVNSSGVVTPVAAGSATITATVAANGDYCEGSVSKNFTINAAACSPSISVSPASANYCKDDVATALSFTGSGHNAQKWQYYDGDSWEDIDGATNATYTPSTSATGSTQYRVVTTCDSYTTTATSSAATVTVKTSPNLTISLAP